ncbi:BglG family transcription antiterminator [Domibacillus robiginosus]|uniref:BglG family transcription antiterminator n=1 Tax=Domibacillus robiginosus TaxID=1071054 RepID=UPI00067E5E17|nr:PRD domain-containing protein [Domibacillus robiginosus]
MFITSREKAIIELIIKTSGKHTAFSIAASLSVSVRTIQRDLKAVEKTLERFDLRLQRNTNEGLMIEGRNEQIFRLIQHLTGSDPVDETPKERKLRLLLVLLEGEESYKIQGLAADLGVSITTLSAYLDELTEWLETFQLELSRKRGVGVELKGSEQSKRKALANCLLMDFSEEIIESLFLLEKGEHQQKKLLHYFRADYIRAIDRIVNEAMNNRYSRLADSDYIGLIIHIGITMQRTEAGFYLEKKPYESEEAEEQSQVMAISKELEKTFSVVFTKEDIGYITTILKGSKLQEAASIPYDSIVLSQMIKHVIQNVSSQLHIDLTNDFSLFQGLLAHMEPSLYRLKQQMGLFNPLTEEIKKKYPVLFLAVKNSVEKEFKEIQSFPDDEIAFIVLHFGSALVMQEEEITLKALVVCPTGIGTSRMLASRIKKEIIEIDSVEVKSLKEIRQQENVHMFDVIISTVRLPFMHTEYILVNPLLSQEDITAIKTFLKKNVRNLTKNKKYKNSLVKEMSPLQKRERPLAELLKELKDTQQSIEALIGHFRVYSPVHSKGYEDIITEMLEKAEEEKLISHTPVVFNALKEREKKGGLGIPNTGMGLFHCRNEYVDTLVFQISHLEKPCLIQGMDGNEMYMDSLLLMLAPEELSSKEQEIMSLLSTSFIESSEAMMIFSSSDEEKIRTKMESIFLDYLHTNLIKE